MEAVQKGCWYSLALLTFLIILKATLQQSVEDTVTLEDGMVLDCLCPWDGNLSMVSWTKAPDRDPVAIYHPLYGKKLAGKYEKRVDFLRRNSMDGSILITNVTEEDVGVYRCSMNTFPLGTWTRTVQVEIGGFSDLKVDTREGENVTIVCPQPNSTVSLVVIKHDQKGIIGRCALEGGTLVLKNHHESVPVNCAHPILGVSFELNNIAKADQGLYQCWLSTEKGLLVTTFQLVINIKDAHLTPTSGPEEAAAMSSSSSSSTAQPVQVLEDPDPAEGIPITEMPSSDAAITYPSAESYPTAAAERMFTTDSDSSAATNSVRPPSDPTEGMSAIELASVIATSVPHSLAVTEAMSTTKLAPAVIATTVLHLPGPTERISSTEWALSVVDATELHTAPPEGISVAEPASSVVDTTVPYSPAASEGMSTAESSPSVLATTVPLPADLEPPEDISCTESTPSDTGDDQLIPDEYWIFIYAGAAGVVGLLILVVIIILVCLHRRRKRREAYRVKLHPGKRWRDSEQGSFYDRMRKGTIFGRQEPIYANVRTGHKHKQKQKHKRKR